MQRKEMNCNGRIFNWADSWCSWSLTCFETCQKLPIESFMKTKQQTYVQTWYNSSGGETAATWACYDKTRRFGHAVPDLTLSAGQHWTQVVEELSISLSTFHGLENLLSTILKNQTSWHVQQYWRVVGCLKILVSEPVRLERQNSHYIRKLLRNSSCSKSVPVLHNLSARTILQNYIRNIPESFNRRISYDMWRIICSIAAQQKTQRLINAWHCYSSTTNSNTPDRSEVKSSLLWKSKFSFHDNVLAHI